MYHFIVNPGSRTGKGEKLWAALRREIDKKGINYRTYFTDHAGHATEIAREICENNKGSKKIVIVGGDGTANEAINGLSDYDNIVLGYIPTGSSNDLARGYHIPSDPMEALKIVLNPKKFRKVDHGVAKFLDDGTERRFAVSSGIGYDADICYKADTTKVKKILNKLRLGKTIYYLLGIGEIFAKHPASATLTIDDKEKISGSKLIFAANMILPIEGGGMPMSPEADPGDGMIDTCFVRDVSRLRHISAMPLIFKGNHTKVKGIDVYRGRSMVIKTSTPLIVHTDGEYAGRHSHIEFTCYPTKILMVVE